MTTKGATIACPICEYECVAREDVRFHLHTRHSKSDLVDAVVLTDGLLDADERSADPDREEVDTDGESVDADALIAR